MMQLNPTHGIASGEVFLYAEKMPYVASGYGDHGILRFNQSVGKLQCHECGDWFPSVAHHIKVHGLSPGEYKLKHGLTLRTALENPQIVALKSERAKRNNAKRASEAAERLRSAINAVENADNTL
jgi:ROS/MUCR transcriptional regulator protein